MMVFFFRCMILYYLLYVRYFETVIQSASIEGTLSCCSYSSMLDLTICESNFSQLLTKIPSRQPVSDNNLLLDRDTLHSLPTTSLSLNRPPRESPSTTCNKQTLSPSTVSRQPLSDKIPLTCCARSGVFAAPGIWHLTFVSGLFSLAIRNPYQIAESANDALTLFLFLSYFITEHTTQNLPKFISLPSFFSPQLLHHFLFPLPLLVLHIVFISSSHLLSYTIFLLPHLLTHCNLPSTPSKKHM